MAEKSRPIVLIILDGWGIAQPQKGNAITNANTPNFDKFVREYPAMSLNTVGVENDFLRQKKNNSQIGHMKMGAGRVCHDIFSQINRSIEDQSFFSKPAFLSLLSHIKNKKSSLHLIGLISAAEINSSVEHCLALLKLAKQEKINKVFVHVILDGVDVNNTKGMDFVCEFEQKMKEIGVGKIASLSGRSYAMDSDSHWDRTEKAYQAIVKGLSDYRFTNISKAFDYVYSEQVFDDWFTPSVIERAGESIGKIEQGDGIIFFNFDKKGMTQLAKSFVLPGFHKFSREYISDLFAVSFSEYEKYIPIVPVFVSGVLHNSLTEVISRNGLKQIHLTDFHRFAELNYFFNGGHEEKFENESRRVVKDFDIVLEDDIEMTIAGITKEAIKILYEECYDFMVVNYPSVDIIGQTGDLDNTIHTCELLDKNIGKLADHILARDGIMIITSSHGRVEEMIDLSSDEIKKSSTSNSVPFVVIGEEFRGHAGLWGDVKEGDLSLMPPAGHLSDVAPTILKLLGIEKPVDMTGKILV